MARRSRSAGDYYETLPLPFAKESATSKEAAESIAPKDAATIRTRVFDFIRANEGATCDEVEAALGLNHQTASPRVWELRRLGKIVDAGAKRKTRSGRNATVWEVRE